MGMMLRVRLLLRMRLLLLRLLLVRMRLLLLGMWLLLVRLLMLLTLMLLRCRPGHRESGRCRLAIRRRRWPSKATRARILRVRLLLMSGVLR